MSYCQLALTHLHEYTQVWESWGRRLVTKRS